MAEMLSITIDDKLAIAAFQRAPAVIERHVDQGMERGADELARAARDNAARHDWLGTLRNMIHTEHPELLHYAVVSQAKYARAVEDGTGPAAGKPPYFPDWTALIPYVRSHALRGGEPLKKSGSSARFFQEREFENRAFQLARYISHHGTKQAPYMKPALAEKDARVRQLVRQSTAAGVREVFG